VFKIVGLKVQDTSTPQLLLLYEFEAYAKLDVGKAEEVLARAITLNQCEPKTLETISAFAMESPLHNRYLAFYFRFINIFYN